MTFADQLRLCLTALWERRARTALSILGIAIGVAAVILLTSIGEGTRRWLVDQFTQFGTNVMQVSPGKTETVGLPGVFGGSTHKLTVDDAEALRRIPGVQHVIPVSMAQARVEARGLGRSVYVFGVTAEMPEVWKTPVRVGRFLPPGDPRRGAAVAALGPKVKRELFGEANALGEWIRTGGRRLRVIGVMEPRGRLLGFDMDDVVYLPVGTAMRLFDQDELIEIDVTYEHEGVAARVVDDVRRLLVERHGGEEDFTLLTQAAMLEVFGRVMDVVTLAVGAIGAVSLVVGAIGILTTMWIAVGERTHEIGLVRAIGASAGQVQRLFLLESVALAGAGGVLGLVLGLGLALLLKALFPGLPVRTPVSFALAGLAVSVVTGLASGVLPARRAAALDPIEALRAG